MIAYPKSVLEFVDKLETHYYREASSALARKMVIPVNTPAYRAAKQTHEKAAQRRDVYGERAKAIRAGEIVVPPVEEVELLYSGIASALDTIERAMTTNTELQDLEANRAAIVQSYESPDRIVDTIANIGTLGLNRLF